MPDTKNSTIIQWEKYFADFSKTVNDLQANGVRTFFFQTPLIRNIENLSEFEQERVKNWEFDFNNISDKDYEYIAKVYGIGADTAYLKKVYDGTKVYSKDSTKYLADFRSELVNIINGERFTVGQPTAYKKTIYIYGQCTARGTGVEDRNTIASFLQELLNKKVKDDILVRNRAIGCGSDIHDDISHVKMDCPHKGDIVIFCTDLRDVPIENFEANKIPYYDCSPLFNRPHNYGEWFTDATFHTTPAGNKVIGEYIFLILEKSGALLCEVGSGSSNVRFNDSISIDEDELGSFLESIDNYRKPGMQCGAIIMNCNPLTKGHLYLIESAAAQVEWLYIFVVEEDKSFFKFKDRINLVRRGTEHIHNITVLPSGRFILSADTFPGYFYKDNKTEISVDSSTDVRIFGKYVAPRLGIKVRFVGEEPLDPVTAVYNRQMHEILPNYNIEVREIKRKEFEGMPISASRVRKLLSEKSFDEIRNIVPDVTYRFLKENYG